MMSVTIPGYNQRSYELFKNGTVRKNFKHGPDSYVKIFDNGHGYQLVNVRNIFNRRYKQTIHRLVALHFVTNYCLLWFDQVHHKDNDPKNNMSTNLMWVDCRLNHLAICDGKHCWFDKRWKKFRSRIGRFGLGCFKTAEEAKDVCIKAKRLAFYELYKFLSCHDPPFNTFPTRPSRLDLTAKQCRALDKYLNWAKTHY